MKRAFLFFSIGALTAASPAFGAETEKVDEAIQRLFLSDLVYTRDRHEVQAATSPRWRFNHGDAILRLPLSLQLGITDRFQIGLEAAGNWLQPARGGDTVRTGTLELGGLGSLFSDRERGLALATGLKLYFPPASSLSQPRVYAYEPHFIAHTASGRWHLNFQTGAVIAHQIDQGGRVQGKAKVALGGFVTAGNFGFTMEFAVETDPATFRVAPGALWRTLDWMELGAGFSLGSVARAFEGGVMGRMAIRYDLPGARKPPERQHARATP